MSYLNYGNNIELLIKEKKLTRIKAENDRILKRYNKKILNILTIKQIYLMSEELFALFEKGILKFKQSMFIQNGLSDDVIDYRGSLIFYSKGSELVFTRNKSKFKKLKKYFDGHHSLMYDYNSMEVLEDSINWILFRNQPKCQMCDKNESDIKNNQNIKSKNNNSKEEISFDKIIINHLENRLIDNYFQVVDEENDKNKDKKEEVIESVLNFDNNENFEKKFEDEKVFTPIKLFESKSIFDDHVNKNEEIVKIDQEKNEENKGSKLKEIIENNEETMNEEFSLDKDKNENENNEYNKHHEDLDLENKKDENMENIKEKMNEELNENEDEIIYKIKEEIIKEENNETIKINEINIKFQDINNINTEIENLISLKDFQMTSNNSLEDFDKISKDYQLNSSKSTNENEIKTESKMEKKEKLLISFGCKHYFCKKCLKIYLNQEIIKKKKSYLSIECPNLKNKQTCDSKCSTDILLKYSSSSVKNLINIIKKHIPSRKLEDENDYFLLKEFNYYFDKSTLQLKSLFDNSKYIYFSSNHYELGILSITR
jgi:RNase P subunit RPR2